MQDKIKLITENITLLFTICILLAAILVVVILMIIKKIRSNRKTQSVYSKSPLLEEVDIGASKNIGARDYQQDSYAIPDTYSRDEHESKGYLCVLCDGMGGLSGGDIASSVCSKKLIADYYAEWQDNVEEFFRNKIEELDEIVYTLKDKKGNALRAGTTLVSCLIRKNKLYWASVGDSRIYLFRDREVVQITRDHNYALELASRVENGLMSADEAMSHPDREGLISFVGRGKISILDLESEGIELQKGDIALMCSDGLYGALSMREMRDIVYEHSSKMSLAAHVLVTTAFDKDIAHQDNMSVVLMKLNKNKEK